MMSPMNMMARIMQNAARLTYTDCECIRCQGRGHIESFSHIVMGVCFRCWGEGREPAKNDKTTPSASTNEESLFSTCPF